MEQAAYGMFAIVNNSMVNGIRRVSVERGYDPRDFVLVGAGGATAAHITALAREMGLPVRSLWLYEPVLFGALRAEPQPLP